MTDKDRFILNRHAFAAKTIAEWIKSFGKPRAMALVADALAQPQSDETLAAFATAFGQ